jgi:hypothetical protein
MLSSHSFADREFEALSLTAGCDTYPLAVMMELSS